jgi:hypothetical protein
VPVHFLDLASAVEKLRWAEKEWRDLEKEIAAEMGEGMGEDEVLGDSVLVEASN